MLNKEQEGCELQHPISLCSSLIVYQEIKHVASNELDRLRIVVICCLVQVCWVQRRQLLLICQYRIRQILSQRACCIYHSFSLCHYYRLLPVLLFLSFGSLSLILGLQTKLLMGMLVFILHMMQIGQISPAWWATWRSVILILAVSLRTLVFQTKALNF